MKFAARTALGIDISDGRINLALLKQDGDGIKLLKFAGCPLPEGAIRNGNITDAVSLAREIKSLKAKHKIRANHTAMSLVANPVLLQILRIPLSFSGSISRFVRNELKQYAILPVKNVAIDYCGLKSLANANNKRVVVAATDSQKIVDIIKALNKAGVNIDAIEPASIAYIRTCFAGKIEKRFKANQLLALINDNVLTILAFKNQTLEFLRTKRIEAELSQQDNLQWLAEEISTVIRFFELEADNDIAGWDVTIVTDVSGLPTQEAKESLRKRLNDTKVSVKTTSQVYPDSAVSDTGQLDNPSAVAVGLAMKFLNSSSSGLNLNLVPAEIAQIKTAKKQALLIAKVTVVVLFIMFLSVGFLNVKEKQISQTYKQKNQSKLIVSTGRLLDEQNSLDKEIDKFSEKLTTTKSLLDSTVFFKWSRILSDIALAIPKQTWLTNLSSSEKPGIVLEGQANDYEPVYLFVETLKNCKHIKSASISSCKKDINNDLLKYEINCSITE